MNLYVTSEGEVLGPYAPQEVSTLVKKGTYPADVLVCSEGQSEWKPFSTLFRQSLLPPPPPPNVVQRETERTFYEDATVKVTNMRFIVGEQTYVMRNITSVKPYRIAASTIIPFLIILGAVVFLGIGASNRGDSGSIALGGIMLVLGIVILLGLKTKHFVMLTTAGGEVRALESTNKDYIAEIVEALNSAIIAHP